MKLNVQVKFHSKVQLKASSDKLLKVSESNEYCLVLKKFHPNPILVGTLKIQNFYER